MAAETMDKDRADSSAEHEGPMKTEVNHGDNIQIYTIHMQNTQANPIRTKDYIFGNRDGQ